MTGVPLGAGSCRSCRHTTEHWPDYFCPKCGTHNDVFYCYEAVDPRPRSRGEIIEEYRSAGMTAAAARLATTSQPASGPLTPVPERPAPRQEPTALTQRNLWELLDSA